MNCGKRIYLTDKEVAELLEISTSTLSRIMSGFVRGGSHRKTNAESIDLRDAKPVSFGGNRRWRTSELARILNMTEEELLDRLS